MGDDPTAKGDGLLTARQRSLAPVTSEWTPLAFDPEANQPVAEWDFDGQGARWGAIDALGKRAAVALKSEPKIVLLDLDSRSELGTIEVKRDSGGNHVSSLAFEPSGNRLAIGLPMGTVKIVDTATRETLQDFQFSKDGRSFTPVNPLTFDGVGDRVLGFTGNHVVVWDASTGEELSTFEVGMLFDLEVTPDGTRAATLNPSESLKIWDIQTASEICALPGQFSRLAIHPDGSRVATWSRDNQAVIASISDCSTLATWPAELPFVPELAWAADGEHLILGSVEGPLHVYVASSGEQAAIWTGQAQVPFVYSSPQANRVLCTGLGDGSKASLWGSE